MAPLLPRGLTAHLSLALDHGQFFVLDRDAIVDDDSYTAAAQRAGLAQFDGGIAVFTESAWTRATHVRVRLSDSRPTVDVSRRHHVVLGGFVCPSGEIRIFRPRGPEAMSNGSHCRSGPTVSSSAVMASAPRMNAARTAMTATSFCSGRRTSHQHLVASSKGCLELSGSLSLRTDRALSLLDQPDTLLKE